MIFYFTGTGNSQYAAESISKKIKDDIFNIVDYIDKNTETIFNSEKPYIFVCPTYAYKIPRVVEDFILKNRFEGNNKAYFVLTCGSYIGNAQKHLKKLCAEKQIEFMGVEKVIMPENYVCMFSPPSNNEALKIIKDADNEIFRIADEIKSGVRFKNLSGSNFMTYVVNPVFYKLYVNDKKFYSNDKCISCGLCAKVCPLNNVEIKDGKPVWKGNCTQCQACICACPKEAIEYGKISVGKHRYFLKNLIK